MSKKKDLKIKLLSNKDYDDCRIADAVMWGVNFAEAVLAAGNSPIDVLATFTKESIATMISNGLTVEVDC